MNLDLFDSTDPAPEDEETSERPSALPPEEDEGGSAVAPAESSTTHESPAPNSERASEASPAATSDEPRIWTVTEVNRAVRSLLERTLPNLWIGGEVTSWTRARSGHRYFCIKDDGAQLDCVMWRQDAERLPADPEEGTAVRAFGSLTLYEARGRYQFAVRKLEGEGAEGLWRIAFEKLRRKLEEEGLLSSDRKRPLPRFPRRIGVVTSTSGAALHDILTVVSRRAPWTRVLVRGTRVQGEGSAKEIAAALRVLASDGNVDVVIVSRGGGSIEDLWAFNEEPVARAIAECPVPVISAVGHEVDVTIADLVADARAPTPSAAGEAVVPDGTVLLETLRTVPARLVRGLRGGVERRWQRVDDSHRRLGRAMDRVLTPRIAQTERARARLASGIARALERKRSRLVGAAGKVEALSPLATLRRGYAVPLGDDGVLRSIEEFEVGSDFRLRIQDGRVGCRVVEREAAESGAVSEVES